MTYHFRPQNYKELYNLRHSIAHNVVERIFGVLKAHFRILHLPPEYKMEIQAEIPPAACALHNVIRHHDAAEIDQLLVEMDEHDEGVGELATGPPNKDVRMKANATRDEIAKVMWEDYLVVLAEMDEGQ